MTDSPQGGSPRRWQLLMVALIAAGVVAALVPALDIYLAGDDFEWLASAYDLVSDPVASLEPINHFFRPLIKWTYLGDYLAFGTSGVGYMATNLAIHLLNAALLYVLMRRRLGERLVAASAAAAFALSPLLSEAVLWAAGRPDTVLLTCWLGALLLLDRWCDRPGAVRAAAFTVVALLGIGAKESWIVFPMLAAGYVWLVRRERVVDALRRTAVLWLAWIVNVLWFLVLPALRGAPTAAHYADFGVSHAVVKTARTLLGYLGLGWLPAGGPAAVVVSVLGVVVIGVALWRNRDWFGGWALLWLAASLALAAPFPIAVLRHNYLPLAGFWLLAAALVRCALRASERSHRRWPVAVIVVVAVAVLGGEAWAMQREIADYRFYGELHRRLVTSFAAVEPGISHRAPLVLVDRSTVRGVELAVAAVEGCPKTFFVRRDALWQLVFLPPLADFVGDPFVERLRPLAAGAIDGLDDGCTVLVLDDSGFELRPDLEPPLLDRLAATGELPPGVRVYRYEGL